jgi:repressor of nif and glnA expression
MTTYDPDTLEQDVRVLRRIANEFEGTMALDTAVVQRGHIAIGDRVELLEMDEDTISQKEIEQDSDTSR